jgi:hypothetical protein
MRRPLNRLLFFDFFSTFSAYPDEAKKEGVCRTAAVGLFLGERRKGREKRISSATVFLPR